MIEEQTRSSKIKFRTTEATFLLLTIFQGTQLIGKTSVLNKKVASWGANITQWLRMWSLES